ncbi:hypothetical protein C3B55_00738 [Candidatus Pseudomonas adelgestsugas]|uniref:Uncharacterized protein n=1 Tax=Candidatus Pseudomonas adelgestsugas TaxID=1302376 RepID=A0ABX5R916_9PSED|nr:hypothetical protein C3B55_00738 [Candidatus Pseudomonas adelgestsugas]
MHNSGIDMAYKFLSPIELLIDTQVSIGSVTRVKQIIKANPNSVSYLVPVASVLCCCARLLCDTSGCYLLNNSLLIMLHDRR